MLSDFLSSIRTRDDLSLLHLAASIPCNNERSKRLKSIIEMLCDHGVDPNIRGQRTLRKVSDGLEKADC